MAIGVNIITRFVKAKTPEVLTRKMRKIQIQRGNYVPFFDIQFADGFWFAWYKEELSSLSLMNKTKERKDGIS